MLCVYKMTLKCKIDFKSRTFANLVKFNHFSRNNLRIQKDTIWKQFTEWTDFFYNKLNSIVLKYCVFSREKERELYLNQQLYSISIISTILSSHLFTPTFSFWFLGCCYHLKNEFNLILSLSSILWSPFKSL